MRYRHRGKLQIGDKRTVIRFLFFPKCLKGEWRWLEFAQILQERIEVTSLSPIITKHCQRIDIWVSKEWVN